MRQAGLDYLHRLGGGCLRLTAGEWTLRNAVHLRPGVDLEGAGGETVLRKCAGFSSAITRPADWYETQVEVEDASGFRPGDGVMVWSPSDRGRGGPPVVIKESVVGVEDSTLRVSRRLDRDAWPAAGATASLAFPLLTAIGERGWDGGSGDAGVRAQVSDVRVSGLVLDGNREQNHDAVSGPAIDGNYAAAVFLQHAHRIRFDGVTVRRYNGDGFSFQVCDDVQFLNCCAEDCGPVEPDGKAEGVSADRLLTSLLAGLRVHRSGSLCSASVHRWRCCAPARLPPWQRLAAPAVCRLRLAAQLPRDLLLLGRD